MADANQLITLGIGTPSDIEHFILFGLGAESSAPSTPSGVGGVAVIYSARLTTRTGETNDTDTGARLATRTGETNETIESERLRTVKS